MPIPRKVAAAPLEINRALYRVTPGNVERPQPKLSVLNFWAKKAQLSVN
jgi:hypothetical protein